MIGVKDVLFARRVPEFRVFNHDLIYFYFDPRFSFPERLVSEDDEYRIIFTPDGETLKVPKDEANLIRKSDVGGIPIDYSIKG